jgi:type IV secretory pathway VirB10-like protein
MVEMIEARSAPVLMQVSRPSLREIAGDPATAADGSAPGPVSGESATRLARLTPPASRWQISAGSTIAASLLTRLNSDLPGLVVAQVTEPVFDSATGGAVLIPQGARLLGRYDNKIGFGQRRALLTWERLVVPDGSSITLDDAPATDSAGFSGLSDQVDMHTWQLLKGIGLSTLLGAGTELTLGRREADLVRALRESVQSNTDRAGQKIVERNVDVAPTLTVRPGFPVRVLVHKDLVLPPWRG